jgi:chromosome segregation ATPase
MPAQTAGDSAQARTQPPPIPDQSADLNSTPAPSMEHESPRTYRVPSSALPELQQDNAAIEVQKRVAIQLASQLKEAKDALAEQKTRAETLENQLSALKEQLDHARSRLDNTDAPSVFKFNTLVKAYDESLKQVREQWNKANALDEPVNDLVTKVNAQNHLVSQMVDAYYAKVRQMAIETSSRPLE